MRRHPLTPWSAAANLAMILGGGLLFATSAAIARQREVPTTEEQAFTAFNHRPALWFAPTWTVMQSGSLAAVPVVGALSWWSGRRRTGIGVSTAGAFAWALPKITKRAVRRGRPEAHLSQVQVRGQPQRGLGFPSGHAAVSTTVGAVVGPSLPPAGRIAILATVASTAAARMYVGAHLPLDVVGGIGLGMVLGGAANLMVGGRDRERLPR